MNKRERHGMEAFEIAVGSCSVKVPDVFVETELPEGAPGDAASFRSATPGSQSLLVVSELSRALAMPFDKFWLLVDGIHGGLASEQGLIEADTGTTKADNKFAYGLIKTKHEPTGVEYSLTFQILLGQTVANVQAFFDEAGNTGLRDAYVYARLQREGETVLLENWSRDPYDDECTTGFLMTEAEKRDYDFMFPDHPLTVARDFIEFLKKHN